MTHAAVRIPRRKVNKRLHMRSASPVRAGRSPTPLLLPVDSIRAHPMQLRRRFDDNSIRALADSFRAVDVLQPIVVRPLDAPTESGQHYELIAGERRLRAARLAALKEIPAIIKRATDQQLLVLSLVENLHREDLNPIEKARAYRTLHVEQGLSHDEIGRRMGEDRKSIGNAIRLLELGEVALGLVESGALGLEHGKLLLGVRDIAAQSELARQAAGKGWTVRYLRFRIKAANANGSAQSHADSTDVLELQTLLSQALGINANVKKLVRTRGCGLRVECGTRAELSALLNWWRNALEAKR